MLILLSVLMLFDKNDRFGKYSNKPSRAAGDVDFPHVFLMFFFKNRPLRRCDDRHLQCGGGALGPLTLHLEPMPLLARVVAVLNSMELAGSSRCSRREGQERPAGHTTSGCGGSRSTWSRCLAFAAVASYLLRNMGQWRPRCCERVTRGASSRIEWNILEYTTIYLNI